MPFCQIDRPSTGPFQINYEMRGDGPTKIFLIMGLGVGLLGWEKQVDYFDKIGKYSILSFDNRGVGFSDLVRDRATTLEMAFDASSLLDHVGWSSDIHLVGISMGGMISLELSLLRPDLFTSLTLTSTTSGRTVTPFKGIYGLGNSFLLATPKAQGDARSSILFPQKFLDQPAPKDFAPKLIDVRRPYCMKDVFVDQQEVHNAKGRKTPFAGFLAQLSACLTHHVSLERLNQLRDNSNIRILVCTGTEDHLVRPSNSVYLAEALGAKLDIYQDCGHVLLFQECDRYNRMLENHIEGIIDKIKK